MAGLQHLVRVSIEVPQLRRQPDLDEVEARRADGNLPLLEVLAVLVEDLDAMVVAVVDEYAPRLDIDANAMNVVHVAGARFLARLARHPKVERNLPLRVELGTRVPL